MEKDQTIVRGVHRVDQGPTRQAIGPPRRVAPSWILVSHDTRLEAADLREQCVRNAKLHHVRNMVVELEGTDAIGTELLKQLLLLRSTLESRGGQLRVVSRRSSEAANEDELDSTLPIYRSIEAAFESRRDRGILVSRS